VRFSGRICGSVVLAKPDDDLDGFERPFKDLSIEDDTGCQPLTSTPVKNGASGPTGKHSLELNSVFERTKQN